MGGYAVLLFGSCLLALFLTPLLRRAAIKNGALDYPNERKLHKEAIPRVGGIAIVISFFGAIVLGYTLFRSELRGSMVHLAGLSVGAAIISLVGVWDDLWGLKARRKLIGQVVAVLAIMPFGFVIRRFGIPFVGIVEIGWKLGMPLTLFWIVGIANTINFIDGMDGLAAGTVITISSVLFVISVVTGQLLMAIVCLILAGSTLGFLRYNFHPATIFMGDCGAMFLGFMLAAVSVEILFQNPSVTASSFVPVLIFGLPIVDTSWAIIRRLKRRRSPFHADSLHIHHRLINLDFTQRQAVLVLYAVSSLSVTAGLIIALTGSEKLAVILSASMLAIALAGIMVLNRVSPSPSLLEHEPVQPSGSLRPVVKKLYRKS
jgi:UDP-GlcNAc:undecaprenyl-phosphate GlcNAc-1-phosphate transferase